MFQALTRPRRHHFTKAERAAHRHEKAVERASRQGEHGMHLLGGLGRWGGGGRGPGAGSSHTPEERAAHLQARITHMQSRGASGSQLEKAEAHLARINSHAGGLPIFTKHQTKRRYKGRHRGTSSPVHLLGDDNFLGKSLFKRLRKAVQKVVPKPLMKIAQVLNPLTLGPVGYMMSKNVQSAKKAKAKKKVAQAAAAPYAAITAAKAAGLEKIKQQQAQAAANQEIAIAQQQEAQQEQDQAAALAKQQADYVASQQLTVSTPDAPYNPNAPTPTMLPPSTAAVYAPAVIQPQQQPYQMAPAGPQMSYEQASAPMATEWSSQEYTPPPQQVSEEIDAQMPSEIPGDYQEEGQFPTANESEDIMQQTTDEDADYAAGLGAAVARAKAAQTAKSGVGVTSLILVSAGVAAYFFLKKKRR